MSDVTEAARRTRMVEINMVPGSREALEAKYGQVWSTSEVQEDFSIEGFMAPYVVATRKRDGQRGSLEFQHSPRFYFSFQPYNG